MMLSNIARTLCSVALLSAIVLWLAACGGDGGSDTGTITIGVTDAPVDEAENVTIEFDAVEIKPANGDRLVFPINPPNPPNPPKSIDLLSLQGGLRETLIADQELKPGLYNWIRLQVNAENKSFIVIDGQMSELCVRRGGDQDELMLNTPFEVREGEDLDFTIDFDLRKSVRRPQGQPCFVLGPVLRLVDTNESGAITGTVQDGLLATNGCLAEDAVVYVFVGTDIDPDDVDGKDPEPVTSARLTAAPNVSVFNYRAAFLEPGDYTVALTCEAGEDEPEEDDDIVFLESLSVTVEAGKDARRDFTL